MEFSQRFYHRLQLDGNQTEQIYTILNTIDSIKAEWRTGSNLSPQIISRLQTSVLVTSTGASTRIEGSTLTDAQVQQLFQKRSIQKFTTRDEQEVAGYIELLEHVFSSWRELSFSENMILSFHKELLQYSEKDQRHKGQYKFGSNRVEARDSKGNLIGIIFDPTPPHLVAKEMRELLEWTERAFDEEKKHPLLIIANFIFEFLAIHPFQDGNGRISRILTNFLLLKSGYAYTPYVSHEKLVEQNKAQYYLALNTTQRSWKTEEENIFPWLLFFLKMVQKQSELAHKILHEEVVEVLLSQKQLQVWNFALSQKEFSRKSVIQETGLKARTVEMSIQKLMHMGKLEKLGEGRATRYRVKEKQNPEK